jgi:uncharacterized protein (TIGR02996 family)
MIPSSTLTTPAVALVRAVHLAPDDDAPRLILADWYDEHGDPDRAALIRWMVRVPSYVFTWNQSRHAFQPKHTHAEPVRAIRGLRPRLAALCRVEWSARPGVERVVMRRGLAEALTVRVGAFLASAGDLFASYPVQSVAFPDLRTGWALGPPVSVAVTVSGENASHDHWPVAFFPDRAAGDVVTYADREAAVADLSRRAAGFGRRMAGVVREPPPLPSVDARPGDVLPRPVGYGN